MPRDATARCPSKPAGITVVGIDVGGERKGFHAVALRDGNYYGHLPNKEVQAKEVQALLQWCRDIGARVIAVDAPCGWSKDGRARPAERELMGKRIWCFSTPTKEMARNHPTKYFDWMQRGEKLYKELKRDFPLCQELPRPHEKCCFETFPHAITWQLGVPRRHRRKVRKLWRGGYGLDHRAGATQTLNAAATLSQYLNPSKDGYLQALLSEKSRQY